MHSPTALTQASDRRTTKAKLRELLAWVNFCRTSYRPLSVRQLEGLDDLERATNKSLDRIEQESCNGK